MFHSKRVWVIVDAESPETLARQLTQMTYCCCNGFRLRQYVFVNDATSGDGAQEYGVLRPGEDTYLQIESYTFSWATTEQALAFIRAVLAGEYDHECYDRIAANRLQTPAVHGRCGHCA